MYYIGLDVHKKTISYCVKDASGQVHQEGQIGATRWELDGWMKTLPQPWTVAMEATRLDLRSSASACSAGEGSASADAARHRCGQEEERSHRCRQDRRLPALRLPAGMPHASTAIRDRRRTLRYRHLLVRQMVQMKNRITGQPERATTSDACT